MLWSRERKITYFGSHCVGIASGGESVWYRIEQLKLFFFRPIGFASFCFFLLPPPFLQELANG